MNARLVLIRPLKRSVLLTSTPWTRLLLTLAALVAVPALAAAQTTTQVVEYYHTDAIGSVRAVTKQVNGQWQVVARHDFMPFGEEVAPPIPPPDKRLFTGKERDAETGQDYFEARYLRASVGRFSTIDPVYTWKENLEDPQRWNRYAYVRDNPLKYTDPHGLYISGCALVQLSCVKAMAKFERERQKALRSKDVDVSGAAASFGPPGELGVVVTPDFKGELKGAQGATIAPVEPGDDIKVLIDPQSSSLQRTIVHEGTHVGQMRAFLDSVDPSSGKYDQARNVLVGLGELRAFENGAKVLPYWVGGALGTLGPNDRVKILQYLTRTPPYLRTFGQWVFGGATWPQ